MGKMRLLLVFTLLIINILAAGAFAQSTSQTGIQIGGQIDEMDIIKDEVDQQLYLYREVMDHLGEISEQFSDGYIEPDEALKKVLVLRHTYNQKADPVPTEAENLHELMNKMFSRLENYFIQFKYTYRENPYVNAKVAEAKFHVSREAERLEYTYLNY